MKKIRETLEPWNPLSIFSKGKPPPNRQEPENNGFVKKGVEKSKSAEPIGHIFGKPKVVAKKLLAKSPSNEGFYSVNPVVVEDQFQGVWTPLDFDIDALYAVPRKRNKINRNEQTMELSYANLADSKFQPLTIKTSGEELHYQIVKPKPLRCKRSKSAQNLHKSELKVFLQRTPSCEIDAVYDVPGKAKPVGKIDKNYDNNNTKNCQNAFSKLKKYAEQNTKDDNNLVPEIKLNDQNLVPEVPPKTKETDSNNIDDNYIDHDNVTSTLEKSLPVKSNSCTHERVEHFYQEIPDKNEPSAKLVVDQNSLDNDVLSSGSSLGIVECLNKIEKLEEVHADVSSKPSVEVLDKPSDKKVDNISLPYLDPLPTPSDFSEVSLNLSTSTPDEVDKFKDNRDSYEYWQERIKIREPNHISRSKSVKISKAWRGFKGFLEDEKRKLDKLVSSRMNDVMRKRTLAEMDVDVADGASSDVGCRALVKNEDFFNANREKFEAADAAKAQGQNGYEDLRRYIKSGEDLNKELATILQERAEAEMTYAKQLCKLSSKLNRACRDSRGGVAQALRGVASDMEGRGDVHRQFSNSLSEEIVRPLRQLADAQHRTRKSAELVCDKSLRQLSEWRAAEAKAKKQSHQAARENEKLQDASLDARLARAPSLALMNHSNHAKMHPQPINQNHQNQAANNQNNHQSEKDAARTEQKRKKAELAVKKADVEYYTLCVRAERARLDWESSVTRACRVLEALERERVIRVKGAIGTYCELSEQCAPLMGAQRETQRALARCDPDVELEHVQAIRRQTEGPCEQLLPDFYCEHTTLAMNRERRKQALVKLLQLVRQDLIREKKSRTGVETLYRAMKQTNGRANDNSNNSNHSEGISQDESQQNIEEKLYHIRCMLLYLEGARYKLHAALCELDHRAKTDHPLAAYLRVTRDRTGLQQSVLRAPSSLRDSPPIENNDTSPMETPDITSAGGDTKMNQQASSHGGTDDDDAWSGEGRGAGDGLSNQRDSDYDEFSSQGSFNDDSTDTLQVIESDKNHETKDVKDDNDSDKNHDSACETDGSEKIIGYCKALYEYQPVLDDELPLRVGDLIGVIRREQDGWWVGLLKGRVGVFPATYVQDPADNKDN